MTQQTCQILKNKLSENKLRKNPDSPDFKDRANINRF